jgi:hypothetical protein
MKINVIRKAVELYSLDELKAAEEAILNESTPLISIEGEDEGEQLTHCMAATWIKEYMQENNVDVKEGLRAYTGRVRNSIN